MNKNILQELQLMLRLQKMMSKNEITQTHLDQRLNDLQQNLPNANQNRRVHFNFKQDDLIVLELKSDMQCIQKLEQFDFQRKSFQLNSSQQKIWQYSQNVELDKKRTRKWMRELCQYEWAQIMFSQNNTLSEPKYCELLRYNMFILLLKIYKMISTLELEIELVDEITPIGAIELEIGSKLEIDSVDKITHQELCCVLNKKGDHARLQLFYDKIQKLYCHEIIKKFFLGINQYGDKIKLVNFERSIARFAYRVKIHELCQKYSKYKWWQTMHQEEWIQKLFLVNDPIRFLHLNIKMRMLELFTNIQMLMMDVNLEQEYILRTQHILETLQGLCIICIKKQLFAQNNPMNWLIHQKHELLIMEQTIKQEQLLMRLKNDIYEEQQYNLEMINASLSFSNLFSQYEHKHQLIMLLQYQLQKEELELQIKRNKLCQEWKKWIIYYGELTPMRLNFHVHVYDVYSDWFNT